MGFRLLDRDAMEQSPVDDLVGAVSHAPPDPRTGLPLVCTWNPVGRQMGRLALPGVLCDHAGFSRLWTAGNYGRRHHIFLDTDGLADARPVAVSTPERSAFIWTCLFRRFALEI